MTVALTSEISPQHKVKDEKAIIIVLESIAQVDYEGVIDLGELTIPNVSQK